MYHRILMNPTQTDLLARLLAHALSEPSLCATLAAEQSDHIMGNTLLEEAEALRDMFREIGPAQGDGMDHGFCL